MTRKCNIILIDGAATYVVLRLRLFHLPLADNQIWYRYLKLISVHDNQLTLSCKIYNLKMCSKRKKCKTFLSKICFLFWKYQGKNFPSFQMRANKQKCWQMRIRKFSWVEFILKVVFGYLRFLICTLLLPFHITFMIFQEN